MSAHINIAALAPTTSIVEPNLLKSYIAKCVVALKGNCHVLSCCHDQNVTSSRVTTEKLTDIINLMNKNYNEKKQHTNHNCCTTYSTNIGWVSKRNSSDVLSTHLFSSRRIVFCFIALMLYPLQHRPLMKNVSNCAQFLAVLPVESYRFY